MIRTFVAISVLLLTLSASASAKSFVAVTTPVASDGDRSVLATIVAAAVSEVKMCELAGQQTPSAEIHAFCRSVSVDSGHIAVQAGQLATRLGAGDLAALVNAPEPTVVETLADKSGEDFDRSLLLAEIGVDGNSLHAMRYGLEFGTTAPVRRFESSVMPVVRRHLDAAETLLTHLSESSH